MRLIPQFIAATAVSCLAAPALAEPVVPAATAALIERHYAAYGASGNPEETFSQTAHDEWANCSANGQACQTREQLVTQLRSLHKLIPDLKWRVLDILVSGTHVIVRGEGAGTPSAEFLGVPHSGRGFKVMSIDIHTVRDGKIEHTHHLEDWIAAVGQLAGR